MEKSMLIVIGLYVAGVLCSPHPQSTQDGHYDKDGKHDESFDHKAVLGSKEEEKDFSKLSPEEAKARLTKIIDKMDENQDKKIDKTELTNWIKASFISLDKEDAVKEVKKLDKNADGVVSWTEYTNFEHHYTPEEFEEVLKEEDHDEDSARYKQFLKDEKTKFESADVDKDGNLTIDEFVPFTNPHQYDHMYDYEFAYRMRKSDKDKDGFLNFTEYFTLDQDNEEHKHMLPHEQEQFKEYDKDKNGLLDKSELRGWVMLTQEDMAGDEADHLINHSDEDYDDLLTKEEILNKYQMWVGSETKFHNNHVKDEL